MVDQVVSDTLRGGLQPVVGNAVHGGKQAVGQAAHDGFGDGRFLLDQAANPHEVEASQGAAFRCLRAITIGIAAEDQAFVEGIAGAADAHIRFAPVPVQPVEPHITRQHAIKMLCRFAFLEKHMAGVDSGDGCRLHQLQRRRIVGNPDQGCAQQHVPVPVAQLHGLVHVHSAPAQTFCRAVRSDKKPGKLLFPRAYLHRTHRIFPRPAIPDARETSRSGGKRIDFDQTGLQPLCGRKWFVHSCL
ncbi:hypothetical protein AT6N2_C3228 [Agrobacterium tumefaciens]|nr:hypothetical protein AT6N2_C3228 [Agrobacterium tumefaciens]